MKKYFFLDRRLIQPQAVSNAAVFVEPIQKDTEHGVLFTEEFFAVPPKKWEARYDNGYPNVLYDPEERIYRCYYTLFLEDPDSASTSKEQRTQRHYTPTDKRSVGLAYAQSRDGVHWEKPTLGQVEFQGSRENNILFRHAHGTGVMLDAHEKNPTKRYKLVTKMDFSRQRKGFMAVNFSADGIHWGEMQPWPEFSPQADSHNFPFYDAKTGKYRVITRCWRDGVRVVVSYESDDFLHWSSPREILRGYGFEHQIYAMPVFLYQDLYFGMAAVFHEGERLAENFDTVDSELYYAVTPDVFNAVKMGKPFIPRGGGAYPTGAFDCGCIYSSVPVEIRDRLYFYYMGGNGRHTDYRETSLARGWIRKDHFAYYAQREMEQEAVVTTTQLRLNGETLLLTADMAGEGSIKVSVREKWNGPALEGFAEADIWLECVSEGVYRLRFRNSAMEITGRPVCFRFRFTAARLYALEGELEEAAHRLWEGA